MKLFAVFFLATLAFASAVPLFSADDLESEIDEINDELGDEFIIYAEGGFGDMLRKRFEEIVERIKARFDKGEGVDKTLMDRAQGFYDRMKNLGIKVGERIKEIFEDMRSKMGGNAPLDNFKELLRKLRQKLQDHEFDSDKIKALIEKIFGQSEMTNQFVEMLKTRGEQGKQRVLDFIDRILGDKETQYAIEFGFIERLKKQFEELVEKMQKNVEEGKGVNENMMKKANDFYEKLKNLPVEVSDKIKKIFEDLQSKFNKSSVQRADGPIVERIRERLENLINRLKKNFDDGKGVRGDLMKKANDVYEKFKNLGHELSEKFKSILEDLRSRVSRTRSVKDIYEKVKTFFKDLNIELKEKFVKFGEYVKEKYNRALDKTKSDVENVKRIAKEFLEDTKQMSKDLAEEAQEFFREYKEDLGSIYDDVRTKVREILKKD